MIELVYIWYLKLYVHKMTKRETYLSSQWLMPIDFHGWICIQKLSSIIWTKTFAILLFATWPCSLMRGYHLFPKVHALQWRHKGSPNWTSSLFYIEFKIFQLMPPGMVYQDGKCVKCPEDWYHVTTGSVLDSNYKSECVKCPAGTKSAPGQLTSWFRPHPDCGC